MPSARCRPACKECPTACVSSSTLNCLSPPRRQAVTQTHSTALPPLTYPAVAFARSAGGASAMRYQWPWGSADAATTTWLLLASLAGHALTAMLFAWRAEHWFRKRIF